MGDSVNGILDTQIHNALDTFRSAKTKDGLNPSSKKATEEEIDQKAQEFESVFMAQVLNTLFDSIETDPLFGGGQAETIFRSMLLDKYADAMSSGHSMGLADQVKRELMKLQEM